MRWSQLSSALVLALALALALAGCGQPPCNGECAPGFVCNETLMACVPEPADAGPTDACRLDADCPGGDRRHCEPDSRRCVACVVNGDCAGGHCSPTSFACIDGPCQTKADCGAQTGRPQCSAAGTCVECLSQADCPSTGGLRRTCDPLQNRCLANPCRADADCSTDPGGRVCDSAGGACVACLRDEQCPPPVHGTARCQAANHLCVACLSNSDCDQASGEACEVATGSCHSLGCVSDSSCAPLRCDGSTRSCVACLSGGDCSFGGLCVNKACTPPAACTGDADCVWPHRCAAGACVACRADADCGPGQGCSQGACHEPASCTDARSCTAGRTCTDGACQPASCAPDAFEPDDDASRPSPLPAGTVVAALCPNERDFYALALQEGAGAAVTVTYDPTQGTPTLTVLSGPAVELAPVAGSGDVPGRLVATVESAPPGTRSLLVEVAGGDGVHRLAYTLDTQVNLSGLCADDPREPDDTPAQAPLVSPGFFEGTLCPLDLDYLLVDVPQGDRVVATLTPDGAPLGSVYVEIYSVVAGSMHKDVFGLTTSDHPLSARATQPRAATAPSKAWVLVRNNVPRKLHYTLTVDVSPMPPANDTCLGRAALALNASTGGALRAATDDGHGSCGGAGADVFYALTLTEASKVTIAASADFPAVLALTTGCDGLTELGCATRVDAGTRLAFEALSAGSYVLRVDAPAGVVDGTFQLSTTVTPARAPPAGVSCDAFEPLVFAGDVATASGSVALADNHLPASCGTDGGDAVYGFTLAAPRHLKATLTGFAGGSVALVAAGTCPGLGGALCVPAGTGATPVLLERTALEAGDWRLVVDGGGPLAGAFGLTVELSDALFPPANDRCQGALPLAGTVTGDTRGAGDDFASACSANGVSSRDEVYALDVTGDTEVHLALDATFEASVALVAGPCGAPTPVACADGRQPRLSLPALPTGTYYVWVDGYAGGSGTFTLTATTAPAQPLPANDTCQAPELVDLAFGPQTRTGQTSRALDDVHPDRCVPAGGGSALEVGGPDVVYAVDVPAGRTLVARLTPLDFDGNLYVLDACDARTCRAASDQSFQTAGGVESLEAPNGGTQPQRLFVVVDSWRATARGAYSLDLSLR